MRKNLESIVALSSLLMILISRGRDVDTVEKGDLKRGTYKRVGVFITCIF